MDLTTDQALQKGVEAHKAGQVQEADRLYTAILKAQPKHPDANHNLGVLAVGVGKVQESFPFFKKASEANPSIGQFWLSYIDILIKLDRMVEAKAVPIEAKEKDAGTTQQTLSGLEKNEEHKQAKKEKKENEHCDEQEKKVSQNNKENKQVQGKNGRPMKGEVLDGILTIRPKLKRIGV